MHQRLSVERDDPTVCCHGTKAGSTSTILGQLDRRQLPTADSSTATNTQGLMARMDSPRQRILALIQTRKGQMDRR